MLSNPQRRLPPLPLPCRIAAHRPVNGRWKRTSRWNTAKRSFRRHWQLYLIMVPGLLYFVIFKYIPMVNAVIAFKDYNVVAGIWGSQWVGFKHFEMFFSNPVFWTLLPEYAGPQPVCLAGRLPDPDLAGHWR